MDRLTSPEQVYDDFPPGEHPAGPVPGESLLSHLVSFRIEMETDRYLDKHPQVLKEADRVNQVAGVRPTNYGPSLLYGEPWMGIKEQVERIKGGFMLLPNERDSGARVSEDD